MLVHIKDIVKKAKRGGYAIGAFNVNKALEDGKTMDQIRSEMEDEDPDDIEQAVKQGQGIRNLYAIFFCLIERTKRWLLHIGTRKSIV